MKKNTAFVKKLVCSGDVFKNPSNICNEAFLRKQLLTIQHFHNGGPYKIENNPLICRTNQWTGFYMIKTSVTKEFNIDVC